MAATYHHPRRLYIGTTAEMAAAAAELDVDGIGTDYWDTDVEALYIWDGVAWVSAFAALPHGILSATHADTTPAAVVRGDLMTGQGVAPLWTRLAHPGAANRVLQSTALEMGWSAGSLILGGFTLTVPATGTAVIGGGAANQITYWTDANTLAGDAGLVYNAATDTITIAGAINPVAAAGQNLGDATHRWKVYAAYVDAGNGGWFGILGNEQLTVNGVGNFTFSGVTSVVVPDGCWVGADAACSWVFDSTAGDVTTLDNVGMGIAAPLAQADVRGKLLTQSWLHINDTGFVDAGGGDTRPALIFGATDDEEAWYLGAHLSAVLADMKIGMYSWALGGWLQTWQPDGRIGVLTETPSATFDVRATWSHFGANDGDLFIRDNALNYGYSTDANFDGWINYEGFNHGTTQFRDLKIADGKHNVLVWFDGSAGTLAGGGNRYVAVDNTGKIYAAGPVSDIRLKKNISNISDEIDVLKTLNQLNGIYFNLDHEKIMSELDLDFGIEKRQIGLVAQNVEKVLPELVDTYEDGYKRLNYQQMVGFLVEVCKAQQVQIDALEAQ